MKKHAFYLRKLAFIVIAATAVWQSGFGAEPPARRDIPAKEFGYKNEIIRLIVMLRSEASKGYIQGVASRLTSGKYSGEPLAPGVTIPDTTPHITLTYANIPITNNLRGRYSGKSNEEIKEALKNDVFQAINASIGRFDSIKLDFQEVAVQGALITPEKWLVARYSLPRDAGQRRLLEKMFNEAKDIIRAKCGYDVWFDYDYLSPHVSLAKLANDSIDNFLYVTTKPEDEQPFIIKKERGWLGVDAHVGMDATKLPLPCKRAMGIRPVVEKEEEEEEPAPPALAPVERGPLTEADKARIAKSPEFLRYLKEVKKKDPSAMSEDFKKGFVPGYINWSQQ